ncbi:MULTISPECIES: AAA family ATPase [Pseudomonas]|uniref:AAA family ATPase n=1 Tax=Pseudomonas canavaninivorans TaxID=2842348 RepID=A0ABX8QKE0_PSECO|nr:MULTISPECIES: AAA family ATPase [Pseudomonas]MBJ2350576.1 AAA family ATPase [Pseudomonas canavaninivorans]MBL3545805.1 AAA family ATPase [Pseudomonas sp. HB05]MCL6703147.1 AAA family ATPase [Pseudomonas sp. T1.Ur]QXI55022.1 AAA family ATPase [Pseudomonas alvandae]
MHVINDSDAYPSEREAVQRLAPQPSSIRDTGLTDSFLGELVCKHLHDAGVLDMTRLVERLALTGAVLEEVLAFLRKDGRVEVLGQMGQSGGQTLRYGLTERGRSSARDALARSGYIGAAPFPVSTYRSLIKIQTIHHGRITAKDMNQALAGMVLSQGMLDQLGVALNSGRAIMIYGPAGTGKTYVSSRLIRLFAEAIWVPHAIVINESVIEIYDPQVHQRLDDSSQTNNLMLNEGIDRRLLCCKRPIVITGGELSMEQLDVRYDPFTRQYQAALQLKASNGLFIIDDMGRQRMAPAELLNRWIVPMEEKRDFINLGGGRHCELPFDLVLVFSTNLNPLELADEAFLRRIGYKVQFGYLKPDEYERIWRQECERLGIPYDPLLVRYVLQRLYASEGMPLVPCHPRDLLNMALDRQRYLGGSGPLLPQELEWAWHNYFVQLDFL